MKILVISNLYPSIKNPFYGSFVKNFVQELVEYSSETKVELVALRGKSKTIIGKVFKYLIFYNSIFFHILFQRYDVIYIHLITHSTLPVLLVSKIKRLNLIFNIHGQDLLVTTPLAAKLLEYTKPLLYQATLVVVPSNYFKNVTLRILPSLNEEKIFVSPSAGVGDNFFSYTKVINNDVPVIGYVSRIDKGKGWDIFIKAASILSHNGIEAKYIIAGGGEEIEEMYDLIKSYNLRNIRYIGPKRYDELPSLYAIFDVFVFPTMLEESLGLVGLEAMATGTPIIASRIGGIQDYVVDGENSFFFQPGNEVDLATKLKLFIQMKSEDRAKISHMAKITASMYGSKKVAIQLFDYIFNEIMNKNGVH